MDVLGRYISAGRATLLVLCCLLPDRAAIGQDWVDTSYHLSGSKVARFPNNPDFVEARRYLLHGEKVGSGCSYHSTGLAPYKAEWVLEHDYDTCTQIRARGWITRPVVMPAGAHSRCTSFSVRFDSTRATSETVHRDTLCRMPPRPPND